MAINKISQSNTVRSNTKCNHLAEIGEADHIGKKLMLSRIESNY